MIGGIHVGNKGKPLCTVNNNPNVVMGRGVVLDHHIFKSNEGWRKSESMRHPMLQLQVTTNESDYVELGIKGPQVQPCLVTAVTDTGAQSCLWGTSDFLRCGFKKSDLIPVKRVMVAANHEPIRIDGAIIIRLMGKDREENTHVAPVMVYVSPDTKRFYLSREALIQLKVISSTFPQVGGAMQTMAIEDSKKCSCLPRSLPPSKPQELPFTCTPENNEKMKDWLLKRYAASTFNKCPHQPLKGMSGPEIRIHVDPDAKPVAVQTPAMVPLHWHEKVEQGIKNDCSLGVLEKPPMGEPQTWVHRMVLSEKEDGSIRRMVDLSPLNKHCVREVHHVRPPFQQARAIPPSTWKTVTDAWNGYHSVPIREEDRHLTTFITPWGRFRYKVAPQGFLASGDGYTRRFDEIIAEFDRKTKCVDDTVMWDSDLKEHWWRTIDFLELLGNNGVVLNPEKFQFAQREIDFAGFHISETEIKPHAKFLKAIAEFPTPTKVTDVRSWFGLVHQVANYGQLTEVMVPFKKLLSPKVKFYWDQELQDAFTLSKQSIVKAIQNGVEIFDFGKPTCLRPDWSTTGLGYFLSQKHCECEADVPGCCNDGWKITMAGSRFLKPCEARYAAVEGEALAIQWSLDQTKYFTLGCKNLIIVTDHKPLVKLFGDRTLDEISNTRLFRLKQKTLLWRFRIVHMPGKSNLGADAMSRHPVKEEQEETASVEGFDGYAGLQAVIRNSQEAQSTTIAVNSEKIQAVTWERVQDAMHKDKKMQTLRRMVESVFPDDRSSMPDELLPYWPWRDEMYVQDGVILKDNNLSVFPKIRSGNLHSYMENQGTRVLIPPSLRQEVLESLHAAHQGVSAMNERAKVSVFWPGITNDIQAIRHTCKECNRTAPSQAKTPAMQPLIPTTPFEALACDYFHFKGYYYLVTADRLSGWTEQIRIKVGTNEAGANGLCKALRRLFSTFGVPIEISSDGGPEFIAKETSDFLKRWGVRHRMSSVCFPSSNGRAELAVKSTKRLLMNNVGPNGELDNDAMVRALLTQRNTPDPGCRWSPAQVLFGRQLRDSLPYLSKDIESFSNPQITPLWRTAWQQKEQAMTARYVKTLENLNEHSRNLAPLQVGDSVFVQNQSGRFPKKWDRCGTVVESRGNDQYVVKISGSGRTTLRNRRFLRRFTPHLKPVDSIPPLTEPHHVQLPPEPVQSTTSQVMPLPDEAQQPLCQVQQPVENFQNEEAYPTATEAPVVPPAVENEKAKRMLTNLFSHNKPGVKEGGLGIMSGFPSSDTERRSGRIRKQVKHYDAHTGE